MALSQEQADLFKSAIANHRKLESIVHEMRAISQEVLLKSAPGTPKKIDLDETSQISLKLVPFRTDRP